MSKAFMFLFLVICCPWANGQSQTPADPYGLSDFGFERKLENRPLVMPSIEPEQARACGTGVYLREETITVNNKPKKSKVVIVYFLPNPSTLSAFGDQLSKLKLSGTRSAAPIITNLPAGFSSLTFFWPPKLRADQSVLFMRAEKVNGNLGQITMNFPARLNVREGDSPSILWMFDSYIPNSPPPELLGNRISSEPAMLKISISRGAKKCIEGK